MRYPILATVLIFGAAGCSSEPAPADDAQSVTDALAKPASSPAAAGAGGDLAPLEPRNACRDIAGAEQFRTTLEAAVKARDADALIALSDPNVKLDFGDGAGTAELRRRLSERNLWQELDQLIALGCGRNEAGGITLPWYFTQETPGVDAMMGMIVTGDQVPMLRGPQANAETVRTLSWDAVELMEGLQSGAVYQHVRLPDGAAGFVATDKLRSLIDYRLLASEQDGKWRITAFIAGD